MKMVVCMVSVAGVLSFAASCSIAVAQTGHFALWEVSLDNGSTWATGQVSAPATQASALVRLRWQHRTNGVVTPVAQRVTTFDAGAFEAYVTTSAVTADTATGFRRMVLIPPANTLLGPTTLIGARRFGNILGLDFVSDSSPLGGGSGIPVSNRANGIAVPSPEQDIALMQYTLQLDGSAGDRVLSGLFVPFNTGHSFTLQPNQISVAGTTSFFAADITHLPTTLTIVPSPGGAVVAAGGLILALRRRR